MDLTKREIVISMFIILVMLIIGVIISGKVSEAIMDSNEKYNKAIKIEDEELFKYGMRTSIGNAFVYGDLEVADTVTYPEIDGEYSYIKKIKEEYTEHTRIVTYTDSDGKIETKEETYWTWDEVWREYIRSEKVAFKGVEFDFSKFKNLEDGYITTIKESSDVRYKYYGSPTKAIGTIFTTLEDNNIGNDVKLYENMNIEQTHEYLEDGFGLMFLFWFLWILVIVGCVNGFYYINNEWLYL